MSKTTTKTLHPRNFHNNLYNFEELIKSEPKLSPFVSLNKYNNLSIDFSNENAVLTLNKALLSHFYNIKNWEIPKGYLCPPIPGRADYIHYIADLLALSNKNVIPKDSSIKGLDIGVGANCIYPIVANSVYNWKFVASDIDKTSLDSVQNIVNKNNSLKGNIEIRLQENSKNIFKNIINENDKFDITVCNPPFHKSKEEANAGTKRKIQNLTKQKDVKNKLNFGGKSNELWCDGGELSFISNMINESAEFKENCLWFSTLVSKKDNLDEIYKRLKKVKPFKIHTIEMKQGQKITRVVAWTFHTKKMQEQWFLNKSNK